MAKKTATIILNRNLKTVVESMYERLTKSDGENTDIYIVESGSESANLPKYKHWWANSPEAMKDGLRFPRGFNFGLLKLLEENLYEKYDYFFFLCNDVEFGEGSVIEPLVREMEAHPRMAILSPISNEWGEKSLIPPGQTRYFWHVDMNAWLVRREFIDCIREEVGATEMNLLFDGSNFRGYGTETELVAKAYANEWAAGITNVVTVSENQSLLLDRADLIRTNPWEESLKLAAGEGRAWMKRKYGFNSRWSMLAYVKLFYDKFFELHSENEGYRVL
jgi:hypothetical protein